MCARQLLRSLSLISLALTPQIVKTWGETVELPAVTKEEAQKAYLAATDVATAMKPAVQEAVQARDDMLKDRFNYVSKHVNQTQYIVAGGKKVAPAGISGASFAIAGFCVLLGAIGTVVYVKTQVRVCGAHTSTHSSDIYSLAYSLFAVGCEFRLGAGRSATRKGRRTKGGPRALEQRKACAERVLKGGVDRQGEYRPRPAAIAADGSAF